MLIDLHLQNSENSDNLLDCRINSIVALLAYYNVSVNNYDIFLLSECITITYGKINFYQQNVLDIPFIVASHDNVENNVFNNLGISYKIEKFDDSCESWDKMKSLLETGTPLLVKMDDRILKTDKNGCKKERIKIHFLSLPLLVGYSDNEEEVQVFWTNSNTTYYPMQLKIQDFHIYRSTECIPYSPDWKCIYILNISSGKNSELYSKIIKEALYRTAKAMIDSTNIPTPELQELGCHYCMSGIQAIKKLETDLMSLKWDILKKDTSRKQLLFSLMLIRNTLLNGTFSAYREEFGKALKAYGEKSNCEYICVIGENFLKISDYWKKFIALIGQIIHKKNGGYGLYIQMCKTLHQIYEEEKKAFEGIVLYCENEFN